MPAAGLADCLLLSKAGLSLHLGYVGLCRGCVCNHLSGPQFPHPSEKRVSRASEVCEVMGVLLLR